MSKKQYPAQTGRYVVKVKSGQSTDKWQDFLTARFQISVGQEYHEGDKFKAMAHWGRDRFEKIYFCVNDSLQRFNIMFENSLTEDLANSQALEKGDQWINRNMPVIKGIPQAQILRWDELRTRESYSKGHLKTQWLYTNNKEFRQAIDLNIADIWNRRRQLSPTLYSEDKFDEFKGLSKRYLLEEMTIFSQMYESEDAIDVYPGTTLFAATLFQGRKVEGAPEGLGKGHFSRIDFVRNY
jgi:tRNA-dependent cyclodipeptide synthase